MDKNLHHKPDDQVATQRNDLIHGQQEFTLVQKRIFALAVQQIRKGDEDYKTYEIDISDLVAAGTSKRIFSQIEDETENLMRKILMKKEEVEGSEFPKTTRWSMVSKAEHNPGSGKLKIDLHPDIRDMLLDLKGKFTPVPVAEILACRSSYGQRLYELLYSQAWKGNNWEISVDELRFSLNIEDKYSNFSDLRRRVLKKAQKDVKKHTNMKFDWKEESRGKGRKITHLIFEFEIKADQMDLALEEPKFDFYNLRKRLKKYAKLDAKEVQQFMNWIEGFASEKQKEFAKNYNVNFENIIDTNAPVSNGKTIQNPKKYFKAHYKEWI